MTERLLVIGGDAGGMSAASQARRRKSSGELEIVAFERGPYTSYSACGIPYLVGGVVTGLDDLIARSPEGFRKKDIDARIGHEVIEVDLDARTAKVRSSDGVTREGFDLLMIGTGALPIRPAIPGADAPGIFGVQTLADGERLRRHIDEHQPERSVVVGGGYIGLEMAEAFKERGMDVSLVQQAPQPMTTLDFDMGELVAEAMRDMGIHVSVEEPVESFEVTGGRVRAVQTKERTLPADVVALGIGVRANVEVARSAGLDIGPSGGVAVDEHMRASADGVWAAGDCTEKFHRISRRPVAVPLGTHANKEGRVAGIDMTGGDAAFPGVLGTAVTKVCGLEVGRTGLNEREAAAAGFSALPVTINSSTRAGYYPGACPIRVKLVVELPSARMLGAQIVGREGAAKRIDVLAAAIWNGMDAEEFLNVDLSYAPPFSPLWDPVLMAARASWRAVQDQA
ncbi:FAD-dependent oxidoreductase [soil metagenome]